MQVTMRQPSTATTWYLLTDIVSGPETLKQIRLEWYKLLAGKTSRSHFVRRCCSYYLSLKCRCKIGAVWRKTSSRCLTSSSPAGSYSFATVVVGRPITDWNPPPAAGPGRGYRKRH